MVNFKYNIKKYEKNLKNYNLNKKQGAKMNNKKIEYEIKYSKIKNIYIQIKNGKVIIKAPKWISKKEIEKIIEQKEDWIQKTLERENKKQEKKPQYTKEEFKKIIEKNANELIQETGLKPNKITIKQIKYAWGSCSNKKNITLNLELIKYSHLAIRYVILHELCHLKYMNHSKNFWDLVEKYMPNYKQIKKEFK